MTPATARGLVRRVGPDPDPPADADLVARFARAADPAAFAALVRRHGPMVLAACRRMLPAPADADDAFQAVFLVLLRKAAAVRPPGAVGGWLHGVAVRTAQKARVAAARRRRREMSVASNPGRGSAAATVSAAAEHAELRAVLDEELARLPEALRTAVVLCDLGGKTRSEAAADLGCPEGTVAARLHRARKLLAERLARRGVTAPAGLAVAAAAVPGDLLAAVAGFAAGGPVPAGVRALAEGVVRGLAANPLSAVFVAVAAVALAAGAGVLWAAAAPSPEGTGPAPDVAPPEPKVGPTYAVGYSPDGSRLVHVGGGKATVRDAATRAERYAIEAEFAQFSRDGKRLYVLAGDQMRTLDAATGKEAEAARPRNAPKEQIGGRNAAFNADGTRWAEHNGWAVHVAGEYTVRPTLEGQGPVNLGTLVMNYGHFAAFSPDGAKVAGAHSVTPDFKSRACLAVWDAATGRRLGTIDHGVNEPVQAFAWSPSGAEIAVAVNGGVHVHDAETLKETRQIPVPPGVGLTALAWSADGKQLAAGEQLWVGENGQGGPRAVEVAVRVWEAATGKELRRIDGFADNLPVVALAFRPDSRELAIAAGHLPGDGTPGNFPPPAADAAGLRLVALDLPPAARPPGPGFVSDLSFSPDGKRYLVVAGVKATVKDAATDRVVWDAPGEAARFTPDGTAVLTIDKEVVRRDAATGKSLKGYPRGKTDFAWHVAAFSPDAARYAGHTGIHARLYDTATGFEPVRLTPDPGTPGGTVVGGPPGEGVVFSPDGKLVAAVGVHIGNSLMGAAAWDTATGKRAFVTPDPAIAALLGELPHPATAAAFAPDGKTLAVAFGKSVVLFETGKFAPRAKFPDTPGSGPVTALAFSPDGKQLAVGYRLPLLHGGDKVPRVVGHKTEVQLLDLATTKELRRFDGFEGVAHMGPTRLPVTALAFGPDGKTLLAGTGIPRFAVIDKDVPPPAAAEVRRFDLTAAPPAANPPAAWREKGSLPPFDDRVHSVAFTPDGKALVVGGRGGAAQHTVTAWDAASLKRLWAGGPVPAGTTGVSVSHDGRLVAATRDKTTGLYNPATGQPVPMNPPLPGGKAVAFCPPWEPSTGPPRYKLAVTDGRAVSVIDWFEGNAPGEATFGPLKDGPKVDGPLPAGLAFAPGGRQLVFIANHKVDPAWFAGKTTVKGPATHWIAQVWGGGSGAPMGVLPHGLHPVTAVAWSPDGKRIATGCLKGDVVVWDAATFQEIRRTRLGGRGGEGVIYALAFTPDGKTLAAAVDLQDAPNAQRVALLDPATGERRGADLQGFGEMTPVSLAFAADGATLAVGLADFLPQVEPPPGAAPRPLGGVKLYTTAPERAAAAPAAPPATWRVEATLPPFDDRVQSVAWSPDGGTLAVGGRGGPAQHTVTAWDTVTLKQRWAGGPTPAGTTSVSFSRDGGLLAATRDQMTGLYAAATGQFMPVGPPLPGGKAVAFSPATDHLAVSDGLRTAVHRGPGAVGGDLRSVVERSAGELPAVVAWAPDGARLIVPFHDPIDGRYGVDVYTVATGKAKALTGHEARVTAAAWSPDGRLVATGCGKGEVVVWDAATLTEVHRTHPGGGQGRVFALAFAPDGETLAAAADPVTTPNAGRVVLLDPTTGGRRGTDLAAFRGMTPVAVAFNPDGSRLAVGLADLQPPGSALRPIGSVTLFTTAPERHAPPPAAARPPAPEWREKAARTLDRMPVYSVAFRPDGKSLAVGSRDGGPTSSVTTWTADTLRGQWGDAPSPKGETRVAYSPSGPLLAATREKATTLHDAASGKAVATDAPLPGGRAVAFGLPGPGVAGRPRHKLAVSDGLKTSVLTWVEGGPVSTATFGPLKNAKADGTPPAGVAFSPSGEQLVFIPNAKIDPDWKAPRPDPAKMTHWYAQVWGGGSGRPMHVLPHGTSPVTAVAWSPTGKHVATACNKGDVVVWDGATFQELRRTRLGGRGGESTIFALAFAPDGATLAAAVAYDEGKNAERVVMLDPATGEHVGTDIQGFARSAPRALAFSPDGKTLAVGCVAWEVANGNVVGEHGLVKLYTTEPAPAAPPAPAPAAWRPRPVTTDRAAVAAVAFTGDGKAFATAAADGDVDLWDAATLKATPTAIRVKAPGPGALAFFPATGFLATADATGVTLHDPSGIKLSHRAWAAPTRAVAFSPDGSRAALRNGSLVRLLTLPPPGDPLLPAGTYPKEDTDEVPPMAWSPDGKRLVAATRLPSSGYWAVEDRTGTAQEVLGHTPDRLGGMAWSRDGKVIVTGGHDGAVVVTDGATLKQLRKWTAAGAAVQAAVRSVVVTPDGATVFAGVETRPLAQSEPAVPAHVVVGWDAATGREVSRFALPPGGPVDALALSPDGRLLVAGRGPAPRGAPQAALLAWGGAD